MSDQYRRYDDGNEATRSQELPVTSQQSENVLPSLKPYLADDVYWFLAARVEHGIKKYGVQLQAFNGRDAWLDAKQEAADGMMYGGQLMIETGKSEVFIMFRAIFKMIRDLENEAKKTKL